LRPKDAPADDAFIDAFFERNREALNERIERSLAECKLGEYHTLKEVMSRIQAQRRRRARQKYVPSEKCRRRGNPRASPLWDS
jgi:uncharacterized protein YdaU (DUF1376 family)